MEVRRERLTDGGSGADDEEEVKAAAINIKKVFECN